MTRPIAKPTDPRVMFDADVERLVGIGEPRKDSRR